MSATFHFPSNSTRETRKLFDVPLINAFSGFARITMTKPRQTRTINLIRLIPASVYIKVPYSRPRLEGSVLDYELKSATLCRKENAVTWRAWRPITRTCSAPTTATFSATWRTYGGWNGPICRRRSEQRTLPSRRPRRPALTVLRTGRPSRRLA